MSLRVFVAATADGFVVMPGGLTRVAADSDRRVVSMQRGGSGKDAWVLNRGADDVRSPRRGAAALHSRDVAPASRGLSSRVAENFFWLGRYSERAGAVARLGRETLMHLSGVAILEDAGGVGGTVDEGAGDPAGQALLQLCRRAWVLSAAPDATCDADAVAKALFDAGGSGSVVSSLRQVLRLASQLRDRLSPDSWRIYNQFAELAEPADDVTGLGDALHRLDQSLLSLATLSGFVMESMPRDAGWRFLSIGRRIERLQFLAGAIGVLLAVPRRGGLEALLAIADGEVLYRARYVRGVAPLPVAELVMLDRDNPRALIYQLESLAEHVAALPDGSELAAPLQAQAVELAAGPLREWLGADAAGAAGHARVGAFLHRIWLLGNALADGLSHRYFTHLDVRSQATASR
jgi:uncharacterized alpha-E superfamily protein